MSGRFFPSSSAVHDRPASLGAPQVRSTETGVRGVHDLRVDRVERHRRDPACARLRRGPLRRRSAPREPRPNGGGSRRRSRPPPGPACAATRPRHSTTHPRPAAWRRPSTTAHPVSVRHTPLATRPQPGRLAGIHDERRDEQRAPDPRSTRQRTRRSTHRRSTLPERATATRHTTPSGCWDRSPHSRRHHRGPPASRQGRQTQCRESSRCPALHPGPNHLQALAARGRTG